MLNIRWHISFLHAVIFVCRTTDIQLNIQYKEFHLPAKQLCTTKKTKRGQHFPENPCKSAGKRKRPAPPRVDSFSGE